MTKDRLTFDAHKILAGLRQKSADEAAYNRRPEVAKARREKLARARARNRDIAWSNPEDGVIRADLAAVLFTAVAESGCSAEDLAQALHLTTDEAIERMGTGDYAELPVRSLFGALVAIGYEVDLMLTPVARGKGRLAVSHLDRPAEALEGVTAGRASRLGERSE